jgi:hypothetical protein
MCLCGSASARQKPGGLDPVIREEIVRRLDAIPNMDPETKAAILRRAEELPKLRCTIEAVTVFTDGIVFRAVLSTDLPFDCRVMHRGRAFSLGMAKLMDSGQNEWEVPPLENHYNFGRLTEAATFLIERGKSVRVVRVDKLEAPRLVRVKPQPGAGTERPAELHYTIACASFVITADLMKHESVYLLGRGKTTVEWKDVAVPHDIRTGVVNPPGPPKK